MGYETEFDGSILIEPSLQGHHRAYLQAFFNTRRMKRDPLKVAKLPDPKREAVGLPPGEDGEFYVGNEADWGQGQDESVVDYNGYPRTQPGLWCDFNVLDDNELRLNDGKNYSYIQWLKYLIDRFFKPWGYKLNGQVRWRGEEFSDLGVLNVTDNEIETRELK